ncbi:sensor histidine kinase [Confluentibacter flavum]|nr:PAS domain S-box protein [Confluentibacter flavum]
MNKRAQELILANKLRLFESNEKAARADELIIANKELAFQQMEKEKRAVALTASNDKLHETEIRLNKVNRLYSFLNHINKTILRVKDEQTLFNEVCRIAVEIGNFKMAWIGIADISRRKIQLVASNGSTEEDIKLLSDKTYHIEGLTDKILHGSEYYAIPNIQAEDIIRWQDYAAARGFISAVSLPIKKSGKVIGTFDMYSSETNLFNDEEIKMLREVAEDISFGVDLFEKEKIHQDTEMLVLKNEKRFRSLIEHGVDMKTLKTREGKALYGSPSVEKSLGYSSEEFLHIYPLGLIHPDEIESYLQKRDALLKTPGKSFDFKQRRLHKNGNWIWCEGVVTNLLEEDGINALVSNFRDISEKKVAEESIIESEKEIMAMAESMPQMVWVTTGDGKNIFFNKQWVDYTGLTLEQSYGDGWLIPFHEDDKPLAWEAWNNAVINLAEYSVECRLRKYDGSYQWWLIRGVPKINEQGQIEKWYGNCTDIEKIKQAEEQVRKSEVFNRGVLNSLISHIAVVDGTGNIISVNETWKQFALENGETTLERIGVGSNYFEVCRQSAASGDKIAGEALNGMMEVMNNKSTSFYLEYPCHSPDEQRWFGMNVKRFEGNVAMLVVAHLNITERKLAENKLIITSNELQHALSDITKIMDSSLDVICAVDAKGNFLKVSAASEAVWGYKPEELIGKSLVNFVYREDKDRTELTSAMVMTGNNLNHFENRYVRKDGSLVPIEWTARWDKKGQVRYGIARDVTEKKRLEKAFEIERQQFFDLFSEAPSSMGVLSGPDHRFEMANPPCLQLIGKKDIIGKNLKDVLPEIMQQGFIEILDSVYQTGKTFYANEILIKLDANNDGILVDSYLNLLYQPHKGSNGKTDGILFFAVDVSEQVLSRKKIEESEARLKEAQALSHISNWGIDLAAGVNTWSDEFYHICGMNPGEIAPSSEAFLSFVHPEDAAYVQEEIHKTFETFAASHFYSRIFTRDGILKYVYSEWKIELDENDKPIRLYGILQDITEPILAKEKLELTQFTFDHAGDAIFWMTSDARIVDVNEAACVSLGYTRQELLRLSVPDIDLDFNVETWSAFFPELRKKHSISIEAKQLRKDGSLFPVEIRSNYIKFGDKEFSCAFIRDITERKKVEQNLERQHRELQKTNTELDRFVYSTSHDLRAPLASLLGLIDITTDEVEPNNELLIEYLGMMKQSVLKLDNFIGDILTYSRNVRTELENEDIVFDDMIQEVLEKHKFMEMASEFKLKVDVKQKAAFISDKRRINIILNNLISNAIKYKDDTKEKSFVHVSVQSDRKNATIIIEDNGIGVAEKDKKKIFEMFYRASTQSTGSGLGLYIVQETIDRLGATMTLESEKSVGSKFTITIFNLLDDENENNITD